MFKFFAVVFAAILAIAVAAPNPGFVASPLVASAPLAYSAHPSPLAYSSAYSTYGAAPLAYAASPLGYSTYGSYAYPGGYAAPVVRY